MKRITGIVLIAILCLTSGCGTLFFSHRIGKDMSDVIDKRVYYTNCALCLFGIIPGVVAFILDYDNKSIYYTKAELLPDDLTLKQPQIKPLSGLELLEYRISRFSGAGYDTDRCCRL